MGGYGHVGTALARELAVRYPGQLIIAGRHRDQAEALAATLPGGADAALVDVYDEESIHQATQHAKLLVNTAIDQRSPALFRQHVRDMLPIWILEPLPQPSLIC